MTKSDLMKRIAGLDREINAEFEKINMASELPKYRAFPKWDYILAALCFAWSIFGASIPQIGQYHAMSEAWVFYAGLALTAIAVLRTLLYCVSLLGRRKTKQFGESSARVRELQDERRELQRQLKELDA